MFEPALFRVKINSKWLVLVLENVKNEFRIVLYKDMLQY